MFECAKLETPRNSTQWVTTGTNFFRKSSRKIFKKYGQNLQNPSENILKLHIPDTGKIFIQVDQSGAEALIVAYLCPNGRFRELFKHGIKPHVYVAARIFEKQWEEEGQPARFFSNISISEITKQPQWKAFERLIKKHPNRYFIGKKCTHAGNYREGVNTFVNSILTESGGKVLVSKREGEIFQSLYRQTLFPEIPQVWWPEVEEQLRKTRTLYNLFGFPIVFTAVKITDEIIRKATSAVPQSTVATITNIAQVEIQNRIEDDINFRDMDVLNNKHDSILCQCDIGHEREVAAMMRSYIEKDLTNFRGEKFKMKSEAHVGYNWLEYDEEKNPQGLRELN